jgi:hypothetical protein
MGISVFKHDPTMSRFASFLALGKIDTRFCIVCSN